jgi:hypothetical protein
VASTEGLSRYTRQNPSLDSREAARRHDCTVRVVKRNGENLAITDDLEPNRINVAVRDRRVTCIRGVF